MALGVASGLPSKSPWHSASTSTKTSSAGFSQRTSIRRPDREVRPDFLLFYRKRERLAVVVGFISMRVCNIANLLGFGGDGSIYTTNCGLRRSPRRGGRTVVVPDVPSSDSRTDTAEISEFRS